MLYFIVTWTLLLIVCCTIGTGGLNWLQADAFQRPTDRWVMSVWLGVLLLALSLLLVSLLVPLSSWVGIGVILGCCGLALLSPVTRSELVALGRQLNRTTVSLYGLSVILVAALGSRAVTWLDVGLYHYPVIAWLNQMGTVPGLALLFANFGFTSSWFALAAPFNPAILDSRASALTGGLVLLITLLQAGIGWRAGLSQQGQFSDWFLALSSTLILLCLVGLPNFLEISISPSPDAPSFVLASVFCWTILVITNSPLHHSLQSYRLDSSLITLIVAIGAATVKLTLLPLVVIALGFYGVESWRQPHDRYKRLLDGAAIIALGLTPFLLAQVMTSGCPLFPSTTFCLNTPWSVSAETRESIPRLTHDWTTWYSPGAEPASFAALFLAWLNDSRSHQLMALVALLSLVASGFLVWWLRQNAIRGGFWVIATQIVATAFYFKTAPQLRFALSCLILIPVLFLSCCCYARVRSRAAEPETLPSPPEAPTPSIATSKLLKRTALLVMAATVSVIMSNRPLGQFLLPPPLQQVPLAQKQVNHITYLSPQNNQLCWNTPLPCAFEIPPDIDLRDPDQGIAAGFIRYQP